MQKVLIVGIKGMAGHVIRKYFAGLPGYVVYGIARNIEQDDKTFSIDVSDTNTLYSILNAHSFDVIVNCIGILNKDAEDNPDKAVWFNSYFPHLLENWTKNTTTKVVHISTDCVFSGKKGAYNDTDFKDGIGFYAQSKALGEIINQKDLTIRTSIIGPELNPNGIGLFHWFMRQPDGAVIKGFTNAFWSGITTIELAKVIHETLRQKITGLFQVAASPKISKYDLLQIFNEVFRHNKVSIIADGEYKVDKSLISTRLDFKYDIPDYEEMILKMRDWVNDINIYSY
ncbi:MAG TPA: SDR family oxidoreductase [Niabella sp.]|nr:SDR family oxidoreductase [Niabella sp.]